MRRWGIVGAVLALAIGGAGALDAVDPSEPSAPELAVAESPGGTWVCPVASVGRGGGYVFLANAGRRASSARVLLVPDRGRPAVLPVALPAGTVRTVAVHQRTKLPVGAVVEYAGGEVVAFHSVAFNDPKLGSGVSAAPCGRPGPVEVAVPQGRTVGGETVLAFLNPGSADAVVNVRLVVGGDVLAPERLARRVVPAGRRLLVRVGDFAFEKPDVTALVRMESGRAVVEGLVQGRAVTLVPAVEGQRRIVVPVVASGGGGLLSVTATGEDDVLLSSRLLSGSGQGRAAGVPTELGATTTKVLGVPDPTGRRSPVAYLLEAAAGSRLAGGARWPVSRRGATEFADTTGAAPARRWVGVLPAYAGTTSVRVLLANPGPRAARVRLRLLGTAGSRALRAGELGAGRVDVTILGEEPGVFGFEAVADEPVVVALSAVGGSSFLQAYAATAVPVVRLRAPAVGFDPRTGVPAP